MIKKILGSFVLKLLGWKLVLDGDTKNLDRCILVVAPHTHNIEFTLGILAYWKLGKSLKIIIKDVHTKAWYGALIRGLGGIGIDRSQKNDLVNFVAQQFKKSSFSLVITPEGTRKYVEKWRKGFYYMAKESNVPIVLAAGDFKTKTIYIGKMISLEDLKHKSYEEILKIISDYYVERKIYAKVPENWNPEIR